MRKANRRYGHLNQFYGAYGSSGGGAVNVPTPLFSLDAYNNTITPTIYAGTAPTFTRSGSKVYYDSPTSLSSKTANNFLSPAYLFNNNKQTGIYIGQGSQNHCLHSENQSDAAWVDVGTVTVTANDAVAPDGATTADELSAGADDSGKSQESALAAASLKAVYSVYIKRSGSSDVNVTLSISGTGATPETVTKSVVATSIWTREYVYVAFTASATGNITCSHTIDTNGEAIYVWGAQLQRIEGGDYPTNLKIPTDYVATVGAIANSTVDVLTASANNFTGTESVGSSSIWFMPLANFGLSPATNDLATGGSQYLYSFSTSHLNSVALGRDGGTGEGKIFFLFNSGTMINQTQEITSNDWHNIVITWNNSANPAAGTFKLYLDGSLINTSSVVRTSPVYGATNIRLLNNGWGGAFNGSNSNGLLGQFKFWNVDLSGSQVEMEYDSTKSLFGL